MQHKLYTLWNEIVSDVQDSADLDSAIKILVVIHHLYIDLHQDTDAAPTTFDASATDHDPILCDPSSYPLCHLLDHHSGASDSSTVESAHSTISLPAPNPTPASTHPTDMSASNVLGL